MNRQFKKTGTATQNVQRQNNFKIQLNLQIL